MMINEIAIDFWTEAMIEAVLNNWAFQFFDLIGE